MLPTADIRGGEPAGARAALVYKLQAERLGALDKVSRRELEALQGTASSNLPGCTPAPDTAPAPGRTRIARPGTVLMREHGGVQHRVMVLQDGFSWNGRSYDSLSQVAFAITGTKWNGPRFFGLRDKIEVGAASKGKIAKHARRGACGVGAAAAPSQDGAR